MIVIAVHIDANENVGVASIDCCVLMFQSNQAYLNRDLYTRLKIKIRFIKNSGNTWRNTTKNLSIFRSFFFKGFFLCGICAYRTKYQSSIEF